MDKEHTITLPETIQPDVEQAVAILKEGGCRAVYLFGSAARGDFTEDSDLDLAVEGCPAGAFFSLYGKLMMTLRRPVDLVDLDTKDDPFIAYLLTQGGLYRMDRPTAMERIRVEIGLIEQLFLAYHDLLEQATVQEPDIVGQTAIASVLHSFYNGIETMFLAVAKETDQQLPRGAQWHQDLLHQMTQSTAPGPPMLTKETAASLNDYQSFRHFFRHSYSFLMKWKKMSHLVLNLQPTWARTKADIETFLVWAEKEPATE
jgi:predicted nucleotidyltransferase